MIIKFMPVTRNVYIGPYGSRGDPGWCRNTKAPVDQSEKERKQSNEEHKYNL